MPAPQTWLSQPVFLSSTFIDMHVERDYLHQYILPEIQERLRAYQEAKERMVLKTCFSEIHRCRPFLFVLLGDRYGWIPERQRVLAAAAEVQLSVNDVSYSITRLEIEYGLSNQSFEPAITAAFLPKGTAPLLKNGT